MTPEQIEFHRKRFEEKMRFKGFVNAHFEKNRIGGYLDMEIQSRFSGYLMAIESIEIEIPDQLDSSSAIGIYATHECLGHNNCLAEVKHNIQSLGLKVKER